MSRLIRSSTVNSRRFLETNRRFSAQTPKISPKNLKILTVMAGVLGFGSAFALNDVFNKNKNAVTKETEADDEVVPPQGLITSKVFLDVSIEGQPSKRIVIGLYGRECPKTALNFLSLCEGVGDSGDGRPGNVSLHYKGSKFHRIIPGFMMQGGDFTKGDGRGGASIFGHKFKDENFVFKHSGVGVVSMANSGPDTNSSQFFICLGPTPWLDGRHVVFGHVLYGIETVREIEDCGSSSGNPKKPVVIVDCGLLPLTPLAAEVLVNDEVDETGRSINRFIK